MVATTRWIRYDVTASGVVGDGNGQSCVGTRGYSLATASVGDTFTIGASNNRLHFSIDGDSSEYVTLTSGTDMDPRFVAKDVSEKIHNLGKSDAGYDQAICAWENNAFKLYSGTLGTSSAVTIVSGTNSAHLTLGWGTKTETGGTANTPSAYVGGITVSGTYGGFFDEVYRIVINNEVSIQTPVKGGSNNYTGTITTGGVYNHSSTIVYTLAIDCTNGTTMGGGTGNVPTLAWTSTGNIDDSVSPVELLYSDYWYNLGTKGLMVKFSDAVFNTVNPAWTVTCNGVQYAEGTNVQAPVGTAKYVYGSTRGDDASSATTTASGSYTRLGTRGLYVSFGGSNNLTAGDEFYVICTGPQPAAYDITNVNFGNVTVSTESPVKCVTFEIKAGAVEIGSVKFGLQSHGTFSHHNENNSDTYFRFGTVGPGSNAGTSPVSGLEWHTNVAASDIASDTPPAYLYATEDNLSVVGDADSSETVGSSTFCGMVADPMWLNIKLGSSEVSANSTICYRLYFDYS